MAVAVSVSQSRCFLPNPNRQEFVNNGTFLSKRGPGCSPLTSKRSCGINGDKKLVPVAGLPHLLAFTCIHQSRSWRPSLSPGWGPDINGGDSEKCLGKEQTGNEVGERGLDIGVGSIDSKVFGLKRPDWRCFCPCHGIWLRHCEWALEWGQEIGLWVPKWESMVCFRLVVPRHSLLRSPSVALVLH